MLSILIAIRDFLVALALAWVGVTIEAQHVQPDQAKCSGQACQSQAHH